MKKLFSIGVALFMALPMFAAYQLVWSDEFDSPNLNTTAWSYEMGTGFQGWGNWEKQYYTSSTNNIYISEGALVIKAIKDGNQYDPNYRTEFTSARIKTLGKVQAKYGKIEARIQLPEPAKGVWPAFWMMGTNGEVWPRCGEFDIMEYMCNSSSYNTINSTLHWYDETAGVDKGVNYGLATAVNNPTEWHVYTMEWTPTTIYTYIDGVQFYAADITPAHMTEFHNEAYILLNMAIGGTYVNYEYDPAITEKSMKIDYVRIYQDKDTYPASTLTDNSISNSGGDEDDDDDNEGEGEGEGEANSCNKMSTLTAGEHYFSPGWNPSYNYVSSIVNNNISVQTTVATYERWQAQFKYNLSQPIAVEPGVQYECSFTIQSDVTLTNKVLVKLMQDDNNFFFSEEFNLQAGVPYQFTYTGTTGALSLGTLLFDFGANPAFNITITDMYFGEVGCTSTGIEEEKEWQISLSPNPTPNVLYIQANADLAQVTIYNLLGKAVMNQYVSDSQLQVNLAELPSGVYLVQLIAQDGQTMVRRVVKK